jgi:hypothetical protein
MQGWSSVGFLIDDHPHSRHLELKRGDGSWPNLATLEWGMIAGEGSPTSCFGYLESQKPA